MGCDMVAALGRATADVYTLFGHNSGQPARQSQFLQMTPGRPFAAGEKLRAQYLELPQARQTSTVLGSQAPGAWGYEHGVNEYSVAMGRTPLRTRLTSREAGLTGSDLVRLTLERSRTGRQAVELLTDLVYRHGQAASPDRADEGSDNAFLVADAGEAFAVETAGRHWVCQEVRDIRALCAACTVGHDWERIAPGLAGHAIAAGWWPADGSKLDFARAVSPAGAAQAAALRRAERATRLLSQYQGTIDAAFLRRLLGDHGSPVEAAEGGATGFCRHGYTAAEDATAASLVVRLAVDARRLPVVWCAFGPPCGTVYFPVFLEGDLPAAFTHPAAEPPGARNLGIEKDRQHRDATRDCLDRLQARFDLETDEFAIEGAVLKQDGKEGQLARQATLFMQHCLERFEEVCGGLSRPRQGTALAAGKDRHR